MAVHLISELDAAVASTGEWIGSVYHSPHPFTWAVASWNADENGQLELEIRVEGDQGWSPWFSFGPWSLGGPRHSLNGQNVQGIGRIATDTLLLERPAKAWQFRLRLDSGALVKRLWLVTGPVQADVASQTGTAKGVDLPVPQYSQMVYPNGGSVWCSPTSLAMAMAYWGHIESIPQQVAPGVYDEAYQGYGNWVFNVAYAACRGFVAYVDRFGSYAELETWIARGVPVIASVSYSRGWLENAPIDQTQGHLLVVRGFTENGDVIVNDPAASDAGSVRRIYRRDQFRRAWLERAGVVYILYPEGHDK